MRDRKTVKFQMGGVLALVLFGVFAACVLMVLLTGADAYRRLTERDRAAFDDRTAAQYLATRVRQADTAGGVYTGDFDGEAGEEGDTLFLTEEIDGEVYLTRIYCCGGYVRELFSARDTELSPEDGEKVLEAASLSFARAGEDVLEARITNADGTQTRVVLTLRSGREAAE